MAYFIDFIDFIDFYFSEEDPRSSDHKILKSLTLSCSSGKSSISLPVRQPLFCWFLYVGNIQDVLDYLTKLKLSSSLKLVSNIQKLPYLSNEYTDTVILCACFITCTVGN